MISYRLRLHPVGQRVAIVFGGFENFCTGSRSIVQQAPLVELREELTAYVRMLMDIMSLYPHVTVYVLPPMFHTLPLWYSSTIESFLPQFLSDVAHIDLARVLVVPPLLVTSQELDVDGVHWICCW